MQFEMTKLDSFMYVGNKDIDDDHTKLLEIIGKLSDREATKDKQYTLGVCAELARYVDYHFRREEVIMEKLKYPDLERHKKLHKEFEEKAHSYIDRMHKNWQTWYAGSLYVLLLEWLVRHIIDEDLRCSAWAREGKFPPLRKRRPINEVLKDIEPLTKKYKLIK